MAKFDIKTEATRPLYAGIGVTDLAVAAVRDYVTGAQKRLADVQKHVSQIDLEPKALREQATTVVTARVDALSKEARARRGAIEKRVGDLQQDARALPGRVQVLLDENVAAVNGAYGDLVVRGEGLVTRIRTQEASKQTAAAAKTTSTKAKTTSTQARKATRSTAKKAATTVKKQGAAPKSSAKATGTAATKTASSAVKAATDAADKVGS